jgi:Transcription termination factor nusG
MGLVNPVLRTRSYHEMHDSTNVETDSQVWHLIRSKLGEEFLAEAALTGLAGEVFLPVLRRIKKRPRGELASAPVPLFSGYLFARLDPLDCQEKTKYAIGVRGPVMSGKVPITVPTMLIDFLKQLMAAQDQARPFEFTCKLAEDKEVRSALESLFLKPLSTDERLMVLLRTIETLKASG